MVEACVRSHPDPWLRVDNRWRSAEAAGAGRRGMIQSPA